MEILIKLIDTIIWPVTILVMAILFKKEFKAILIRLVKIEGHGWSAEFEKGLKKVEAYAKEALPADSEVEKVLSTQNHEKREILSIADLAEYSPRAAITESWILVEKAIIELAMSLGVTEIERRSVIKLLKEFIKRQLIDEDTVRVYNELRVLRNEAVHAPEFSLTPDEAQRYVHIAVGFASVLNNLKGNAHNNAN